jgi:hypothetical protein
VLSGQEIGRLVQGEKGVQMHKCPPLRALPPLPHSSTGSR